MARTEERIGGAGASVCRGTLDTESDGGADDCNCGSLESSRVPPDTTGVISGAGVT